MKIVRKLVLLVLLAIPLLAGCGGGGASANLLQNAGFENGNAPWHTMDSVSWSSSFEVTSSQAHSGKHSLHLTLVPPNVPALNEVFGVVQDISLTDLPEYISGNYFVQNWKKATDFQYLQFVVIVFTTDPITGQTSNTQIRYLLAGAPSQPFSIDNARFVFITKDEPVTDQWVHFGRNIREDFQQEWGSIPENITAVRLFFETRFDSPTEIQPQMAGDVYYDDLYLGPQAKAPSG
jgi:hypothetical protein